jgi:hypothetical protein
MTGPNEENTHDDAACVKMFTDLMARLNEINVIQMQDILDIAIAAADAANSVQESPVELGEFTEKITELAEGLKGGLSSTEMAPSPHPAGTHNPTGESAICAIVAENINLAMQNAVSAQEALNQMAMSVLGKGANLVLNSGGSGTSTAP